MSGDVGPGLEELSENLELMDDWEDRYRYLIDLGRALEPFPEELRTDKVKVPGCMSQVWFVPRVEKSTDGSTSRLCFWIDSDAHLVKGLAAVMSVIFQGKPLDEIERIDSDAIFQRLGLSEHISPNRRNGLASMVQTIKAAAKRAQQT